MTAGGVEMFMWIHEYEYFLGGKRGKGRRQLGRAGGRTGLTISSTI